MINKVFSEQIGKNMEVYVDDILVKSKDLRHHRHDLEETFQTLRKYNMRLNPKKCTFKVKARKFLGFMLTERGIEANPKKCEVINNMKSPASIKEVQALNGRLAALNRFISR